MRFVAFTALTTPALSRSRARIQNAMSSPFFAISLIAAVVVIEGTSRSPRMHPAWFHGETTRKSLWALCLA